MLCEFHVHGNLLVMRVPEQSLVMRVPEQSLVMLM
jgi:hypothetical protein